MHFGSQILDTTWYHSKVSKFNPRPKSALHPRPWIIEVSMLQHNAACPALFCSQHAALQSSHWNQQIMLLLSCAATATMELVTDATLGHSENEVILLFYDDDPIRIKTLKKMFFLNSLGKLFYFIEILLIFLMFNSSLICLHHL